MGALNALSVVLGGRDQEIAQTLVWGSRPQGAGNLVQDWAAACLTGMWALST